ncbi:MAG: nucleotidyltransferase domain-containing protein [Draconibacterium sp.]|nr:nucleotidyltransferase domain-containing protein [Draconibacterium sp.]
MTANELKDRVKLSIKSIDPEARIILFGSKARGDFKKHSDWDFLILTSLKTDAKFKTKIRNRLIDTELEAEEVISALIYSHEKWDDYKITPLYRNISKDGIEL